MTLGANNALCINGLLLSNATRELLIADAAGCAQLETDDAVLINVRCASLETSTYPCDLQAAFDEARLQGTSWLAISNMGGQILLESETVH